MHIGGVQKALVSLLWNIRDYYDVTLMLFYAGGELLKQLPPEIKVITPNSGYRYLGMTRKDTKNWTDWIGRNTYAAIARIFGRNCAVALMGLGQKRLEGYDVAISYLHNAGEKVFYGGCNDFVLNHVSAKKKITFLHCDYGLSGANIPHNNRQYAQFDTIAACSQGCADSFLKVNPEFSHNVCVVPNCHRFDRIRTMASCESDAMDPTKINIVTVARLGKEKGVERAIQVIAGLGILKERIHYYIIGDGIQKSALQEAIEREQLGSYVTFCGQLENPYPYMQAADLLLIPSRSEAAPLVIGEAACLGTPILSMKTSSAVEMIGDTGYGWVCENDEKAMEEMLAKLITDSSLLSKTKQELRNRVFTNEAAIRQMHACMAEL